MPGIKGFTRMEDGSPIGNRDVMYIRQSPGAVGSTYGPECIVQSSSGTLGSNFFKFNPNIQSISKLEKFGSDYIYFGSIGAGDRKLTYCRLTSDLVEEEYHSLEVDIAENNYSFNSSSGTVVGDRKILFASTNFGGGIGKSFFSIDADNELQESKILAATEIPNQLSADAVRPLNGTLFAYMYYSSSGYYVTVMNKTLVIQWQILLDYADFPDMSGSVNDVSSAIVADSSGNVFISPEANTILKFNSSGTLVAQSTTSYFGSSSSPVLSIDSSGNIYTSVDSFVLKLNSSLVFQDFFDFNEIGYLVATSNQSGTKLFLQSEQIFASFDQSSGDMDFQLNLTRSNGFQSIFFGPLRIGSSTEVLSDDCAIPSVFPSGYTRRFTDRGNFFSILENTNPSFSYTTTTPPTISNTVTASFTLTSDLTESSIVMLPIYEETTIEKTGVLLLDSNETGKFQINFGVYTFPNVQGAVIALSPEEDIQQNHKIMKVV